MSETALAAVVVRYFHDLGAEVYQEVAPFGGGSSRADLVAKIGPALHVVECKQSINLTVIRQAWEWKRFAHMASIAVPSEGRFGREVCRSLGLGLYRVSGSGSEWNRRKVEEIVAPEFRRRVEPRLEKALTEKQKTYAEAGNAAGKFWSPFKATCELLRDAVAASPGLTIREAVQSIKHHYNTDKNAISSLHKWIARGDVQGVELSDDHPARLYPAGKVPAKAQRDLASAGGVSA